MLRLTKHRKSRISDRLAIFAVLLLVVTSLAGIGNSVISSGEGEAQFASMGVADNAPISLQSRNSTTVKKNNNFKVSLFLFRNH